MNVARKMAVFTVVRACWLALYASYAVESFVVPVRGPRFSSSTPSLARHPTSAQTQNAGTPPYLPSTLRMSSYDDGSGASAGGDMTGSTEMELQELVVDFTDDGRILLEVKGVKGPECRAITEDLIKALGDVITTENTEEYFEEKIVNVQHDPVQLGWSYDSNKPEW